MNALELNATIAAVANALACQLTREELTCWGIVFSQLGGCLETIAALEDLKTDESTASSGHAAASDASQKSRPA